MPRIKRIHLPGIVQHVMNRGNRRDAIFLDSQDYVAFLAVMETAAQRFAVRLLAFCLMPNHWHLVVWPSQLMAVSAYMRWVTGTHVRRYHRVHGLEGAGHLYQGRYTSVPVQDDNHLLVVLRYVEANPLAAGLVDRAELWPWSSLGAPETIRSKLVVEGPVVRPTNWVEWVNGPAHDLTHLRQAISRGAPFGSADWTARMAEEHGLQFTLRSRGRPRGGDPPHGTAGAAVGRCRQRRRA